jgi:hypothetical protein
LFLTEGVKITEESREKQDEIWLMDKEIEIVKISNNSGLQFHIMQENKSIKTDIHN